jgi:hypothetical protein
MRSVIRDISLAAALVALTAAATATAAESDRDGKADLKGWRAPLVISAADFRSNGNGREAFYFSSNGYITGEGSIILMIAPVYLPTGATVTKIEAHVYDNSASCANPEITVWLNRVGANVGTGVQTMTSVTTSNASSSMQTISESSISYPVVNTLYYTYYVAAMMCSASHELHSVAIYYEE